MGEAQALSLLAALACGLLIGIERGWQQRDQRDGTRVAGVRTFTLIGGVGGLIAAVASVLSPGIAAVVAAGFMALLVIAFYRARPAPDRRDATTMVAAITTLLLGLLAGSGNAQVAVAGAATVALILASREQSHRLLHSLTPSELKAFTVFAVISGAVLPFLPDRDLGPYQAWNPFQLWLVVVLIIGFSVLGYVANRVFGENKGTLTTALIGGAYSSTAVTASLSAELRQGAPGSLPAGIALASAVMYLRVLILTAILAPKVALEFAIMLGAAAAIAWLAALLLMLGSWRARAAGTGSMTRKPFRVAPALGFAAVVSFAALLVRWAQTDFGEVGGAWSLFFAGSFDVDAAIVTYSTLPPGAITPQLAAFALAGTVAVNMAFKTAVVLASAGFRAGLRPAVALSSSLAVLLATLTWRLAHF